ncbi:carcinine hydrolase/isopenicillin-N N-acyltransferase family protein, partial [Bacteroides sp.]|uniref:carcinine hydrolase/isopenicillin-N N-acyltransferase family protein n=1 Tax=Bacteroides sp. TaxID=29523 RepID=UPI002FC69969
VSESILVGSARDGRAAVIEKSPEKIALFAGDGSEKICCTNHYQSPTFADDERNRENLATSDSPYRFERLGELMQRYAPLSPQSAAAILRDRRGPHDEPLRAGNPWAINQLIAHHSVIFQPEQLLMWVSTDPWQCGPYVAYDLKKIFALTPQGGTPSADAFTYVPDPRHELSTPELTLPEDPFVRTEEFRQFMKTRTNRFLKKE